LPKLFLGVLALAWIVVLVPPVLRARNDSKVRGDSIGDFQNRLGVLGHSQSARRRATRARNLAANPVGAPGRRAARVPGHAIAPLPLRAPRPSVARPLTGPVEPLRTRAAERSARRRREVVTVLFSATILSAAVAVALGGTLWWGLQIVTDLAFVAFVVGMVWFRSVAADRMRTVRYLPPVRPRAVPAYALRRTASS
jgi:hypothetical protein